MAQWIVNAMTNSNSDQTKLLKKIGHRCCIKSGVSEGPKVIEFANNIVNLKNYERDSLIPIWNRYFINIQKSTTEVIY